MLSTRSLLLYNKVNKRQFLSKWNYNLLTCVELIKVTGNDCPCTPISGCDVLRTKFKLPKPINSINGYILDSVMSVDGNILFSEVTYKRKLWRKGDKYTSTKPDFFILDDYIYITSTRTLKAISIMGLFADPIEAATHPGTCDTSETTCPIYPMELEFPLETELVDALVKLTLEELVIGFPLGDEDRRNDSVDKIETPQSSRQQRQQRQPRQQQPRRRNE
jgi:hypothetical protein